MRGVMTFVSTQYPDVSCPPPNMHSTCTLIAGLAGWNRNLTPNHTVCWWGISISALLFWFFKDVGEWFISRRQSVYTHTHIIKYHIWHVPHTHHIYAKTIDTLTKCFSHFLFGVAKEHSEEENARLSESDGVNFRQKTSKAFPALCGWAQIFFSSLLPIPWYCLFLEFKA